MLRSGYNNQDYISDVVKYIAVYGAIRGEIISINGKSCEIRPSLVHNDLTVPIVYAELVNTAGGLTTPTKVGDSVFVHVLTTNALEHTLDLLVAYPMRYMQAEHLTLTHGNGFGYVLSEDGKFNLHGNGAELLQVLAEGFKALSKEKPVDDSTGASITMSGLAEYAKVASLIEGMKL